MNKRQKAALKRIGELSEELYRWYPAHVAAVSPATREEQLHAERMAERDFETAFRHFILHQRFALEAIREDRSNLEYCMSQLEKHVEEYRAKVDVYQPKEDASDIAF